MSDNQLTIRDRLEAILESINLIIEWTDGRKTAHDFMLTPTGVMAFNACVMRFQVIGEHIGKLLKSESKPFVTRKTTGGNERMTLMTEMTPFS